MTKQKTNKTVAKNVAKKPTVKKALPKKSAPKKPVTKKQKVDNDPYDGFFALKLAMYVVLGSLWLKISYGSSNNTHNTLVPIPVGLILGMILASRERFRTDRKIDYAVLLIAALVGFFAPFGFYIHM